MTYSGPVLRLRWEDVTSAFVAALVDYGPVTQLYDEANGFGLGSDNGYAVYLAVQCTDVQWPQSWARWKRDNWATYQTAPFLTWSNAWFNAPCLTWGASAPRQAPGGGWQRRATDPAHQRDL